MNIDHPAFRAVIVAIFAFILAPIVVVIAASVSTTNYVSFPPSGFTLRWFVELVTIQIYVDALQYSFVVAVITTLISLAVGTWVALLLRSTQKGRALLQTLFLSPILLPEIALGIGLLQYFSMIGFVRGMIATILAHSIICTPYVIRSVAAVATRLKVSLEESALVLGARPLRVLRDVTIPLLKPGLIGGAVMAFLISFDNVTISMFLAAPGAITLPALLFNQAAESGLNTSLAAISALLVFFTIAVIVLMSWLVGLDKFFAATASSK